MDLREARSSDEIFRESYGFAVVHELAGRLRNLSRAASSRNAKLLYEIEEGPIAVRLRQFLRSDVFNVEDAWRSNIGIGRRFRLGPC